VQENTAECDCETSKMSSDISTKVAGTGRRIEVALCLELFLAETDKLKKNVTICFPSLLCFISHQRRCANV